MTALAQRQERRAHRRSRCLKGARIVLANGNSTLACRIRNQSESGMRFAADEIGFVPQSFTVVCDGSTAGHLCQVTWRHENEFGAQVVAPAELKRKGYNAGNSLYRRSGQFNGERYPV